VVGGGRIVYVLLPLEIDCVGRGVHADASWLTAVQAAGAAGRGHMADPSPVLDDLTILITIMHAHHVGGKIY
jgi:hypothetical protein